MPMTIPRIGLGCMTLLIALLISGCDGCGDNFVRPVSTVDSVWVDDVLGYPGGALAFTGRSKPSESVYLSDGRMRLGLALFNPLYISVENTSSTDTITIDWPGARFVGEGGVEEVLVHVGVVGDDPSVGDRPQWRPEVIPPGKRADASLATEALAGAPVGGRYLVPPDPAFGDAEDAHREGEKVVGKRATVILPIESGGVRHVYRLRLRIESVRVLDQRGRDV